MAARCRGKRVDFITARRFCVPLRINDPRVHDPPPRSYLPSPFLCDEDKYNILNNGLVPDPFGLGKATKPPSPLAVGAILSQCRCLVFIVAIVGYRNKFFRPV